MSLPSEIWSIITSFVADSGQKYGLVIRQCSKAFDNHFKVWLRTHELHLVKKYTGSDLGYRVYDTITDSVMELLKDLLLNTGTLNLINCNKITDASFPYFANIHTLYFNISKEITDEGLQHLKKIKQFHFFTPHVAFSPKITDAGLPPLSNCERVSLVRCQKITDEGLVHLSKVKKLSLEMCSGIRGPGLKHLSTAFKVDLSNTINLTNDGLVHLKNVNVVVLRGCMRISDDGLKHLSGCEDITLTNVRGVSDEGLKHLSKVPFLTLSMCAITDEGLKHLKGCRVLEIDQCRYVTMKGLDNLTNCQIDKDGRRYVTKDFKM